MPGDGYIPVEAVRKNLATIDVRLGELKRETTRIRKEKGTLLANRAVLAQLEAKAVKNPTIFRTSNVHEDVPVTKTKHLPDNQADLDQSIPDGRVATPIILQMISRQPGIKSVEVIEALHGRVTKKGAKSARKFLGDLIWELGHRNKLRRQSDGSLYLEEQGGES